MTNSFDQAATRRRQFAKDQHGRQWFANIDIRSGDAVGLRQLLHKTPSGNRVPWEPDQDYLGPDPTQPDNPTSLFIAYERMLDDRLQAHADYHKRAVEVAAAREWAIPEKGGHYEDKLTQIVGPPPRPYQPIVAAMKGNPWILGFTDEVDTELEPLVRKRTARESLRSEYGIDLSAAEVLDEMEVEDIEAPAVPSRPRGRPRKVAAGAQ